MKTIVSLCIFTVAICLTGCGSSYLQSDESLSVVSENKETSNVSNGETIEASIGILEEIEPVEYPTTEYAFTEVYQMFGDLSYSLENQEYVTSYIEELRQENTYTIEDPLVLYSPYLTNMLAFNVYFTTTEESYLVYTVHVDGFEDYTQRVKNDGDNQLTTDHAYQLIGLIQSNTNIISLEVYNEYDQLLYTKEISIEIPTINGEENQITVTLEDNSEKLSNGLFMVTCEGGYVGNSYLYDNNGTMRSVLAVENSSYRIDNVAFTEDTMIYSINNNTLAVVNRLGQIIDRISLEGYEMHHDFVMKSDQKELLILVSGEGQSTVEDKIISYQMETGEITCLVDMIELMPESYQLAIENDYSDAEKLDWLHFNSVTYINETDILLSSRELSTIIRINHIYTNPEIEYILGGELMIEGTSYEEVSLTKLDDSISLAGQHGVVYTKIDDNTAYIETFNNNYTYTCTRGDVDWSSYSEAGSYDKETDTYTYVPYSYYNKYLVNETDMTYELVETAEVDYSGIMGVIQYKDDNLIVTSAMSGTYYEYDKNGNLLATYQIGTNDITYRVLKFDYNNFWFY